MDRRHFCKIASLAVGAVSIGGLSAKGEAPATGVEATGGHTSLPCRCRVAVLRRECHLDLQSLYLDDPDPGPCPLLRSGDEFVIGPGNGCPSGFCPTLWDLICHSARAKADCCSPLSRATSILACPDGTRPVIIRLDYL